MEDGRVVEVAVKMKQEARRTRILGTRHRPKANLRKVVRPMRHISNRCKRSWRERKGGDAREIRSLDAQGPGGGVRGGEQNSD